MLDLLVESPLAFVLSLLCLAITVTIHEFAHAWMADRLGDPTPRIQDRVTLDPRAHLDPLGSLALIVSGFGWGRPVEFDPYNLKNPQRDSALIALAGPASNLLLAAALSLVLHTGVVPGFLAVVLYLTIFYNVSLAIFNLVPIFPLDGSRILMAILPRPLNYEYEQFMRRSGIFILIFLLFNWSGNGSIVGQVITPIITSILQILGV